MVKSSNSCNIKDMFRINQALIKSGTADCNCPETGTMQPGPKGGGAGVTTQN